jgi:hypothetical protein
MWASIGLQQQPWAVYCLEEALTLLMVGYMMYVVYVCERAALDVFHTLCHLNLCAPVIA